MATRALARLDPSAWGAQQGSSPSQLERAQFLPDPSPAQQSCRASRAPPMAWSAFGGSGRVAWSGRARASSLLAAPQLAATFSLLDANNPLVCHRVLVSCQFVRPAARPPSDFPPTGGRADSQSAPARRQDGKTAGRSEPPATSGRRRVLPSPAARGGQFAQPAAAAPTVGGIKMARQLVLGAHCGGPS